MTDAVGLDADTSRLTEFYGGMSSLDAILSAVTDIEGEVRAKDFYTRNLDCHNLGMHAMLELLAMLVADVGPPTERDVVLDVGCGLGGPGRFLVDRFGCSVVGVDLLALRVDIARQLTDRTGLGDHLSYRVADVTDLPFDDARYAQVWMLDVGIHVRDKARMFAEIARVLQPAGLLVMHDQLGPLPPAMRPLRRRAPYLASRLPQLVRLVEGAGLEVVRWRDTTAEVLDFFAGLRAAFGDQPPPADLERAAGDLFALLDAYYETLANQGGRTGVLLARRPGTG